MIVIHSTIASNQRAIAQVVRFATTFVAGIFALIVPTVAALIAVAWMVSLCFEVIVELNMPITTLIRRPTLW